MTEAGRRGRTLIIAWFATVLGVAWLVFPGGGFYGIYGPQLRLASVVMVAAALLAWATAAIRDPAWRPRSAIWPALAVPLAAFVVSTLSSQHPRISAEYLAYAVLLVGLYLLLRAMLANAAFRDRIAGLAVVLAAIIGTGFVAAVAAHWIAWWDEVGRATLPPLRPYFEGLTYGNPSAVLTMSVLLTAAAAAHLGLGTPGRRAAVAALAVLAATVTLLSGSRAGWLAVGVAVLVVTAAAMASAPVRRSLLDLLRTRAARLGALGIALAAGVAGLLLAPGILLRAGAGGEDVRASYVAIAGRLFAMSPVTGVGAGGWVADRIGTTADGEADYYIPHAHNLYAQTAAEHGLLGLVAGAIAIACLAWLIIGGLRGADVVRRRWAWAALFGTVYFGAHQLLDFYANMPAAMFAFVLPVAWLDATAPRSITAGVRFPRVGPRALRLFRGGAALVAGVAIAVAVAGLIAQETPAMAMESGRTAAAAGNWEDALPLFLAADDADPAIPAYGFALGLAEARTGDAQAAMTSLERLASSDDLPVAWLDVAALRLAAGDANGARRALDRALRLGRQQPGILFAAGALLERDGDTTAGDAAWAGVLAALPSLAGDPWWADPTRATRWPAIRDAALAAMLPETAADLWLSSGDAGQASAAAGQIVDPAARQRTELAIAAWDGSPADRDALDRYAQDHPFDLTAVAWSGRVAARAGDLDALDRYRLWADTVYGNNFASVGEVRVNPAGPAVPVVGLNGLFWGQYTYRRATPADQLVPSLPHLGLTP